MFICIHAHTRTHTHICIKPETKYMITKQSINKWSLPNILSKYIFKLN